RFQNWMLSGSPSRSRGPGSSSTKKSASCSSNDRSPLGTILIGCMSESDGPDGAGSGTDSRVDPGGELVGAVGAAGERVPPADWRNQRGASAVCAAGADRADSPLHS